MAITYNIYNGTIGLIIGFLLGCIVTSIIMFRVKKYIDKKTEEKR